MDGERTESAFMWTAEDEARWEIYNTAVGKMAETEIELVLMLSDSDVKLREVARALAMIVYLTQEAKLDPVCVLDKVEWRLQGIPETKMKRRVMRWLKKNIMA